MKVNRSLWPVMVLAGVLTSSLASPASASALTLSYQRDGERVTAYVVGAQRTGVWRVRVVAPGGLRRIDFILRTGDVLWSGDVRVAALVSGGWTTVRAIPLDRALAGRARLTGCNAGVCWDTAAFKLPRNGDRTLGVTVTLIRDGTYRLYGGVRLATEAFLFGPWQTSGPLLIRN